MVRALPLLPLAAMLAVPAAGAVPVAATPGATGRALIIYPVTITKTSDLDFGSLIVNAAGTAVIEPNANVISTTGGIILASSTWSAAEFVGAARSSSVVNIKMTNQPFTITRQGGTETMTVSNLTLQGQSKRTIAAASSFTFRVGGTLNVAANQREGVYLGTFNVDLQYP